ncbi:membrane protein [Streptococcus suis]|nr:membrane protein [Streptococcus suis]CYV25296.1 membrane protein [Streptococcus suis]
MFVCKKRLVLFTSLLFLSIGGMMMFNFHRMSEEEKLQAQIRKEQERMVLYAVNHYEEIEKIEFTSFEENKMTGSWSAGATINNEYLVTFKAFGFAGDLGMNQSGSKITGGHLIKKAVQTDISNIGHVEVIYLEGDELW